MPADRRPSSVSPRLRAGTPCAPASVPLLTAEEEAALVAAARGPDRRAADRAMARLMAAHEPLFRRAALAVARGGMPMDDALQEVRMAALRFMPRFDPGRGVRMGRFLQPYLTPGALHDRVLTVRDAPVRTSTGSRLKTALILWGKAKARYVALNGCEPEGDDLEETARKAGLTIAQVKAAEAARATSVSFERAGPDGVGLAETLSDGSTEDGAAEALDREMIRRVLLEIASERGAMSVAVARWRMLTDPPETEQEVGRRAQASVRAVRLEERALLEALRARVKPASAVVLSPDAALREPLAPAPAPLDLAKAIQARLPGICDDAEPLLAAPRLRRPPRPRSLRPRHQDKRQALLFEIYALPPAIGLAA